MVRALGLALVLFGCGGGDTSGATEDPNTSVSSGDTAGDDTPSTPPAAPSSDWNGLDTPHPAWVACNADAECTTVEIGCCDHCNGGRVVPANRQSAPQVDQRYSATCPPDQACTERGCMGPDAVCRDGACALE